MCGRFNFSNHRDIASFKDNSVKPNYNISPSSDVIVINENNKLEKLRWGYLPSWIKQGQIINAKAETVRSKSTFKGFRKCYVPINGWYEWSIDDNKKQPYYLYSDYSTLYVKSIKKENTVILLTTSAIDTISQIHHRMPLLSNEPSFTKWNLFPKEIVIKAHKVSNKVNFASNNNKVLIEPIL